MNFSESLQVTLLVFFTKGIFYDILVSWMVCLTAQSLYPKGLYSILGHDKCVNAMMDQT